MSLTYIAQQLTIYIGVLLFIIGIFGNTMNIYIFSTINYRTTPTTFYCLVGSIFNMIYILTNLIPRILNTGFGINLFQYFTYWCKLQHFILPFLHLTCLTCSCLSTIDQFFATSRRVSIRHFSNISWAYRIVIITIIVWFLHSIPTLFFYDIIPSNNNCVVQNPVYGTYVPFYIIGLGCFIPIFIMILFGSLTYKNISKSSSLVEQQIDRQLVRMIFMQVVLVVISMGPYGIYRAYVVATTWTLKDVDRQTKEYFASIIFILISYLYYVGNFYMFVLVSNRFRQRVQERLTLWQ